MSYSVKMKDNILNTVFVKNLPQAQSLNWPVYQRLEINHKVSFCIECFSWC